MIYSVSDFFYGCLVQSLFCWLISKEAIIIFYLPFANTRNMNKTQNCISINTFSITLNIAFIILILPVTVVFSHFATIAQTQVDSLTVMLTATYQTLTRYQRWLESSRTSLASKTHFFKSLALTSKVKSLAMALASKHQVLKHALSSAQEQHNFFVLLKFCWKTPETSRKFCENLVCFFQLEIA